MSVNPLPEPFLLRKSQSVLSLESTLGDLNLHHFQIEATHLGMEVAQIFERHPLLPGVVLMTQGELLGIISRYRLLEFLIRPHGLELFLSQPLSTLYSYARTESLLFSADTPIQHLTQQVLRRSPDQQTEPIVVQKDDQIYLLDAHEFNLAAWQIQSLETQVRYERVQTQMLQTEKMASLGRLVDGVAHEILDPVGFIWGNLTHITTYTDELISLLRAYETHFPNLPLEIKQIQEDIELDYVKEDLPNAIESIKSGAERLKKLVTSLQTFCHIDEVYPKPTDLHDCLDGILLLLKSRLGGEIQVTRNYAQLPPVSCYVGQLSQVFMNILTYSVDVLIEQMVYQTIAEDLNSRQSITSCSWIRPQITITTEVRSHNLSTIEMLSRKRKKSRAVHQAGNTTTSPRWLSIRIANNGTGLSPQQIQKLLDSFVVENCAAKETSLSVSHHIITAKHGGKLYVHSPCSNTETSQGTEFEILLPLV